MAKKRARARRGGEAKAKLENPSKKRTLSKSGDKSTTRPVKPAEYRPPLFPPPQPNRKERTGSSSARFPRPTLPQLSNPQLVLASTLAPDFVTRPNLVFLNSINWNNSTLSLSSMAPHGYPNIVYVDPTQLVTLNGLIFRQIFKPFTEGLLIGRISDGVAGPVHTTVNLGGSPLSFDVMLPLGPWQAPFPPTLYGWHQISLDLWVVNPQGQQLPPEVQTSPPDNRLFSYESGDWAWVWVGPGCQAKGGAAWWQLKSFSVTPTTITLDASGKNIDSNQVVTVDWQIDSAGLPSNPQFGFIDQGVDIKMSPGVWASIKEVQNLPYNGPSAQLVMDLSGLPYGPGAYVRVAAGYSIAEECGIAKSIPIVGVIKNKPPQQPLPANIVATQNWYEPSTAHEGDTITIYFQCQNNGGTATGQFVATLILDNGVQSTDINVPSLGPSEIWFVYWTLPPLYGFQHLVECYFDSKHNVIESSKTDNYSSMNVILY